MFRNSDLACLSKKIRKTGMKKNEKSKNFDGDLTQVPVMRSWVVQQLKNFSVKENDINDIKIALSEALTNIFKHAYASETVKPVGIKVLVEKEIIFITLRDFGKKFELNKYEPPDLSKASTGGYGVYMIQQLMDGVQYIPQKVGTKLKMWKKAKE